MFVFICSTETEVSDSELKSDIHSATKFCYRITAPETVKLKKEVYKDKRFDEFMIFRWHGD